MKLKDLIARLERIAAEHGDSTWLAPKTAVAWLKT